MGLVLQRSKESLFGLDNILSVEVRLASQVFGDGTPQLDVPENILGAGEMFQAIWAKVRVLIVE